MTPHDLTAKFGQMSEREILVHLAAKVEALCDTVEDLSSNGCKKGVKHTEQITSLFQRIGAIEAGVTRRGANALTVISVIIAAVSSITAIVVALVK